MNIIRLIITQEKGQECTFDTQGDKPKQHQVGYEILGIRPRLSFSATFVTGHRCRAEDSPPPSPPGCDSFYCGYGIFTLCPLFVLIWCQILPNNVRRVAPQTHLQDSAEGNSFENID